MSTEPPTERTTHWTATVTVRVPCESDRSLAADAARRLEATAEVQAVDVKAVSGLTPTLSATVVTVQVTLRTTDAYSEVALESALEDAPGAERVQGVAPAD